MTAPASASCARRWWEGAATARSAPRPKLQQNPLMTTLPPSEPELTVAALERWRLFGATWRVIEIDPEHAVLDMCACTGETVERRHLRDPDVIEYLVSFAGIRFLSNSRPRPAADRGRAGVSLLPVP